jgi:hypothetical protein
MQDNKTKQLNKQKKEEKLTLKKDSNVAREEFKRNKE